MATSTPSVGPALAPARTAAPPRTRRSTRILLVEDEPLTVEVFARALTRAGHIVDVARDGLQALRQLRDRTPTLIVLDMSLPALSGVEVVRELRRSGRIDLPIVVVSGSDREQCSLSSGELRPGVWLTKPVKPRDLVAIVQGLTHSR